MPLTKYSWVCETSAAPRYSSSPHNDHWQDTPTNPVSKFNWRHTCNEPQKAFGFCTTNWTFLCKIHCDPNILQPCERNPTLLWQTSSYLDWWLLFWLSVNRWMECAARSAVSAHYENEMHWVILPNHYRFEISSSLMVLSTTLIFLCLAQPNVFLNRPLDGVFRSW